MVAPKARPAFSCFRLEQIFDQMGWSRDLEHLEAIGPAYNLNIPLSGHRAFPTLAIKKHWHGKEELFLLVVTFTVFLSAHCKALPGIFTSGVERVACRLYFLHKTYFIHGAGHC